MAHTDADTLLLSSLAAASTLLLVATLSPGPNNLVVLRTAVHGGIVAAWPAILGIVCGGIGLLVVAAAFGTRVSAWPQARSAIAIAGAAYLGWLGLCLLQARPGASADAALPAGIAGLFCFQFLNPKSWVMALSLVAAFPPLGMVRTLAWLAPLFVLIPTASLLLWAVLGQQLSAYLHKPGLRRSIDRIMGLALLASAGLLLL